LALLYPFSALIDTVEFIRELVKQSNKLALPYHFSALKYTGGFHLEYLINRESLTYRPKSKPRIAGRVKKTINFTPQT